MSRNYRFSVIVGGIFFILFIYFLYVKNYLYALGWLILSTTLFLGAYIPRKTCNMEVLIIVNVILPFVALIIFIYALIYH